MKKVLIADDHAIFREGLKRLIAKTVDFVVSHEAADGIEALKKVQELEFDLVILDISIPGRSGLEVLMDIRKIRPKLPVLIMSMYPAEQFALRAYKAGAAGYLTKGGAANELFDALSRIALGKRYVSQVLAEALADGLGGDNEKPLHDELSIREYQVLCKIAGGVKPQQIADELGMGVKTVGTYRARILQKMRMKSNAELTRYVLENSLS